MVFSDVIDSPYVNYVYTFAYKKATSMETISYNAKFDVVSSEIVLFEKVPLYEICIQGPENNFRLANELISSE